MDNGMLKAKITLMLITCFMLAGCIEEINPFKGLVKEPRQCVTPIRRVSASYVSPEGISITPDGAVFGAAGGYVSLYSDKGELLWTRGDVGSTFALITEDGTALFAESYNSEEKWKSTIVKLDSEGNTLWERQTGLIGIDGLAINSDGSFIAVGAVDQEKNGHLMLFDQDGNRLWDHQIDGRIETVKVSKSGYVVAGPRDRYIYVYDRHGELVSKYYTGNYYQAQDPAIAPDESYFLFGSELTYLNCCTFDGDLLWQRKMGAPCTTRISADGGYIAVGTTDSKLFLFDKNGTELWSKKVTDADFVFYVAISGHGEFVVVATQDGFFSITLGIEVYSKEGELLWRHEEMHPLKAVAISDDGRYVIAGNGSVILIFDNFAAIEEYQASECAQLDKSSLFYRFTSI